MINRLLNIINFKDINSFNYIVYQKIHLIILILFYNLLLNTPKDINNFLKKIVTLKLVEKVSQPES